MGAIGKILDPLLLALVAWRMARCRRPGDGADRFADRVTAVLGAEIERRNAVLAGWAAELAAKETAAADRQRRARAMEQFQSFESENRAQLVQ